MKKIHGPIRFGVVCGSAHIHAWQEIAIKKLIVEADAKLKLVVFERDGHFNKHTATAFNDSYLNSGILWSLYYRFVVKKKSKAIQEVATNLLFEGTSQIYCTVVKAANGFSKFQDTDIEIIEQAELDFILNFSFKGLAGNVLNAAKYGIWSYHFGDPEKYMGSIPCFWEIYYQDPVTKTYLIKLTDEPCTMTILKEGVLKTNIFYTKNLDRSHFEATTWPLQICQGYYK